LTYPQIRQIVSDELKPADLQLIKIGQKVSDKSTLLKEAVIHVSLLINSLSFSHFIELLKADSGSKRMFYEAQSIKNNWGVRELKRAIESQLYQRTGLSKDKQLVIEKLRNMNRNQKKFFVTLICWSF